MKTVPLLVAAMLTGAVVAGGVKLALREKPAGPSPDLADCGEHCVIPAAPPKAAPREPRSVLQASLSKPEKPKTARVADAPAPEAPKPKPGAFADVLSMPETTRPEMETKEQALSRTLSERTVPLLQQRFEAGLTELVTGDPDDVKDDGEIYAVMMKPEGAGAYRTTLPRSEFPDLYRLHDERNRLRKDIGRIAAEPPLAGANEAQGKPRR